MSSVDPWADFEGLKVNVRLNTVDRLKQIISGFNDECWSMLSKSGKKQDLIDRILHALDEWRASSNIDKWNKARGVLYQVRSSGMPCAFCTGNFVFPNTNSYPAAPVSRPYNPAPGPSNTPRYDSFAPPPRNPALPTATSSPHASATATLSRPPIRFKPSPFFRIDQAVSTIVECPESSSSGDRRQQVLLFSLTGDQITKLTSPDPKYQLCLYCTSSSYFALGPAGIRFGGNPVNQVQISASTKGMKKKPGTAPPAHLGNSVRVSVGHQNRVEMVYINSQTNSNQPPPSPKKYYMVIMLVQVTTVRQLIERVKKGKFRSREDILAQRKQAAEADDDDIVAGPQKTSLKCPLSYCRIKTPCRSSHCIHVQCFDALSWFSVNEQTTTWSCPVCEKSISSDDLIVDGYFNSILESTPDTVDDVIVEADGEWHTTDDKYASDAWKKTHKPGPPLVSPTPHLKHQATSNSPSGDKSSQEKSQRSGDVVVLDSEEEDEVIDLTVESDDESASIRSLGKRKAESDSALAAADIWKKSRIGEPPNATTVTDNVDISATGGLVSNLNHGARRYAANGAPLQHRPHSTQFTPVTHGSPFATTYYTQPRAGGPFSGSFGPQVSHRAGYYSQFGNIA
ncbi:PINIT domain-containing protein [Russula vinacea]|nr:PINIT domain-containing protein [Russula vinacea]